MAGYYGYSMSNNAMDAYDNGEMPKSKWTKTKILEQINYLMNEENVITILSYDDFSKLSKNVLSVFLTYSSWHHTSSKYNQTDFYKIDESKLASFNHSDVERIMKNVKKEPVKPKSYYYADVEYGIWEGTKKHPKLIMHKAQALVVEDWAFIVNDWQVFKKKVSGNYFNITKKYSNRKPRNFDTKMCANAKKMAKL